MGTSAVINMNLTDTSALEESTLSGTGMEWINGALFHETAAAPRYMSIAEHNFITLDGTGIPADNASHPSLLASFSAAQSGSDAGYTTPPQVQVSFDQPHTSAGVTLYFADEPPERIRMTWLDQGQGEIDSQEYTVGDTVFFADNMVENYAGITIDFLAARHPGRNVKLQFIEYGSRLVWEGDRVISAILHESVDVTSDKIEINTCDLVVLDEQAEFDPFNVDGIWGSLQRNQRITITEQTDDGEVPCGTFYLNKWRWQNNRLLLSLIDPVGYLDNYRFYDGKVYSGDTAGEIIADIMAAAGWTRYQIDAETAAVRLYGHIPICSCREALQAVCFATRASCDDSRSDSISIGQRNRTITRYIGPGRRFQGSTQGSISQYVSGISVSASQYTADTAVSEAFNGILPAGRIIVEFGGPYLAITGVTGGTLVSWKTNYAVIEMAEEGACVITGRKYNSVDFAAMASDATLPAGETENTKTYKAMVYPANLAGLAAWLREYYTWRKEISSRILSQGEQVGEWCGVVDGDRVTGILLESQTIDLAGGFLAEITGRGYDNNVALEYYTGIDLIAAEDILI